METELARSKVRKVIVLFCVCSNIFQRDSDALKNLQNESLRKQMEIQKLEKEVTGLRVRFMRNLSYQRQN